MMLKLTFTFIVIFKLVASSYNYQDNYSNYQTCKKDKVVNKVPVYELCEYEKIKWNDFNFRNDKSDCNLHGTDGNYNEDVNIPRKFQVYKNRLYFSIERDIGVFCTLNYFDLDDIDSKKNCPQANCYPDSLTNQFASLQCTDSSNYLTNVKDFKIDNCNILWAVDVGSYCTSKIRNPTTVQVPRLCAIDLESDSIKKCYELPSDLYYNDNVLGYDSLLVNTDCGCDKTFVYLFNSYAGLLVVFSLETESFWAFESICLQPDPEFTKFSITTPDYASKEYVVENGAGAVLGQYGITFTPRASNKLCFASYEFLHESSNTNLEKVKFDIVELGTWNKKGQTRALARFNDTVFGIQELNHAIVCYNRKFEVNPDVVELIVQDREKFPFLVALDLNLEQKKSPVLYFLSNNLVDIKCNGFDDDNDNFKFYYIDVKEALRLYPECRGYYKHLDQHLYLPKQKSYEYQPLSYVPEPYYMRSST